MSEPTVSSNSKGGVKAGRSRLEQAAILLLSVGEEAAAKLMQKMNRDEVILLSDTMAR
ncbi:flagellar motor switch protein FliG, partial [Huaxiibacter chinensis]